MIVRGTATNESCFVQMGMMPSFNLKEALSTPAADDPVGASLRASARRMVGIAGFSGVVNVLMLSGSLYMLQVYDRVIPSRNLATLLGLSLMVLFAYLVQGYFEALRSRMLCRVATLFDVGLQGPFTQRSPRCRSAAQARCCCSSLCVISIRSADSCREWDRQRFWTCLGFRSS